MNNIGTRLASSPQFNKGLWVLLAFFMSTATYIFMTRLGLYYFIFAMIGVIAVVFLFRVSTHDLSIALCMWIVAMSGLRYVVNMDMPGLPNVTIGRVLLIWIVLMFLLQLTMKRQKLSGPYAVDVLLLMHTIYILLLVVITKPTSFTSWVLSNLSPLFGFLYGKYVVKEERHIRNLFYVFLSISIFFYYTAIVEHLGLYAILWPRQILDSSLGLWQPGRARGPVLHPPLFGQLQAMVLLVYFYFLARMQRGGTKILLSISLGLSMLGLLLAYTRGPWLAAAASILLLGVLRPNYRKILGAMAIFGVVIGMLGLYQLANSDFLQERLGAENTFEGRIRFIANSLQIIADYPLTGVGYLNTTHYMAFYSRGVNIPFYGYIRKGAGHHIVPHDIYIGRTADEGLISAGLLVTIGILVFRAFVRKWRSNPQGEWFNRDSMAVMAAIMVSYLVGGMVIDYRYFDMVNVLMYLMMGIIYGYEVKPVIDHART